MSDSETKEYYVRCSDCRHRVMTRQGVWGCYAFPKNKAHPYLSEDRHSVDACFEHNPTGKCRDFEPSSFLGCLVAIIIFIIIAIGVAVI
jgi:hypothetical protein